jgi:hypothetical protein
MQDIEARFAKATIRPDAYLVAGREKGVSLFSFDCDGITYFEVEIEFADDQKDFWVRIENFGLHKREYAGMRVAVARQKFSRQEVSAISKRIEEFFLGPEEKDFVPFNFGKGSRVLGIKFAVNWVDGSLHSDTHLESFQR